MKKLSDATLLRLYEEQISPLDAEPGTPDFAHERKELLIDLRRVITAKSEQGAVRVLASQDWGAPKFCALTIRSWAGIRASSKFYFAALRELYEQLNMRWAECTGTLKSIELVLHLAEGGWPGGE